MLPDAPGGCWLWAGYCDPKGYGRTSSGWKLVHRVVFSVLVGPIPEGFELDHVCHNRDLTCPGDVTCIHRRCCNPAHLEPVSREENIARMAAHNAAIGRCVNGHDLLETRQWSSPSAKRLRWWCGACQRERNAARDRSGGAKVTKSQGRHVLRYVSDETLLEHRRNGMTLLEIATKYGCHTSTVSYRLEKIGVPRQQRPRYADLIPWKVLKRHSSGYQVNSLRLLGAYRAGRLTNPVYVAHLRAWLRTRIATNTVVDYGPRRGFSYVPAGPGGPEGHPYYEPDLLESEISVSR